MIFNDFKFSANENDFSKQDEKIGSHRKTLDQNMIEYYKSCNVAAQSAHNSISNRAFAGNSVKFHNEILIMLHTHINLEWFLPKSQKANEY